MGTTVSNILITYVAFTVCQNKYSKRKRITPTPATIQNKIARTAAVLPVGSSRTGRVQIRGNTLEL